MKARIHRGAHEIGGSCVEVEATGSRILIDAGLPLDLGQESQPVIPQVDATSLCAILISHCHPDHAGLLPWMPAVPIAMGAASRRIMNAAAPFMSQSTNGLIGPDWVDRQPFVIGPFRVTPFLVDHSAYDAYALLIEADGKRLFYSGDFRLHGRKQGRMEALMAAPPRDIDALLLEGTTLGKIAPGNQPATEDALEDDFQRIFRETAGLALVHVSAQNIDRLVTIYRACLKTKRTLVVDLYTAQILEATGNPNIPQSSGNNMALAIPHRQRLQIKQNGWFDALKRHSTRRIFLENEVARNPEEFVLLFRDLWMRDLERAQCLRGACYIYSQWAGYLRSSSFEVSNNLRQRHGLPFHQVHLSGHATTEDLQRFASALAPRVIVPIHTEAPELFDAIYPHLAIHANDEWWDV